MPGTVSFELIFDSSLCVSNWIWLASRTGQQSRMAFHVCRWTRPPSLLPLARYHSWQLPVGFWNPLFSLLY